MHEYIMTEYDMMLNSILNSADKDNQRTGEATWSRFGVSCRYPIYKHFPLLMGRKINYKAVFAELLWFLNGETNTKQLNNRGTRIWDSWQSAEFEEKHNFIEGSLGPVYGFQLRHFGGDYNNGKKEQSKYCAYLDEDYTSTYGEAGYDQLNYVLEEIKRDPTSRSIFWSLWNPKQTHQMRLKPCHVSFQILINNGHMTGILYQRSADWPVGVAFNVPFYAALLQLIAQHTGYKAYEFVHFCGDAHIYQNQYAAVKQYQAQLSKVDFYGKMPTLKINNGIARSKIEDYTEGDFVVEDYYPQPSIEIPVAV